jgi:ferric-dicitrate binding protein FerR (iron transport regulator)
MNAADHDRIDRALEGLLSPEELAAFHAAIVRDPALRAAYVDRAWLHGALLAERDRLPELLAAPAPAAPAPRWPWFAGFGLAAAAAVVLAFLGGRRVAPAAPAAASVAVLVQADNTTWAGSTLPTIPQSALGPGMFSLVEGIATVRFASGAVVTLEAPTKLELLTAMHCRLIEGSITADVPESAHGFTVDAPDLRVVDLGTRFGVTASSTGNSHVFVFEGEVELDDRSRSVVRRLTAGKAYLAGAGPSTASTEPNRTPPLQVIDGWTSIETSFGRGRDSYVRRGTAEPAGAQPLLLVKHTELEASRTNERRAILTFDLEELAATAAIAEVQLVLDPEPSGLGFSTMVPDSRFSVYGVAAGLGEQWSEATLNWESLPACDDTGVRAGQAEKLAEFALPRGGSGEPLAIRGEALAPFVRARRGGLATFVIVRETGETDPTGLVHAFASKEHPTARPPTLRVR